jgi:hypothetical protein
VKDNRQTDKRKIAALVILEQAVGTLQGARRSSGLALIDLALGDVGTAVATALEARSLLDALGGVDEGDS